MKRTKINLVIDALLLLCIAAIAGIGLLMKYVLVPGYRRWEIYGQNVNLSLCGMDRHQWGTIHLIIGFVFLALLILHIVLHWGMVIAIYRKLIPNTVLRCIVAVVLICLTILLFAFSFFVKPQVIEQGFGGGHGWGRQATPPQLNHPKTAHPEFYSPRRPGAGIHAHLPELARIGRSRQISLANKSRFAKLAPNIAH